MEHNASSLEKAIKATKCICGIIYVGHGYRRKSNSVLKFNTESQLAVEEIPCALTVHELPTKNFIPDSVSILAACCGGTIDANFVSIAQKMSEHFKGKVMASQNKLNFGESGPYTPDDKGETIWNIFYNGELSRSLSPRKCR